MSRASNLKRKHHKKKQGTPLRCRRDFDVAGRIMVDEAFRSLDRYHKDDPDWVPYGFKR